MAGTCLRKRIFVQPNGATSPLKLSRLPAHAQTIFLEGQLSAKVRHSPVSEAEDPARLTVYTKFRTPSVPAQASGMNIDQDVNLAEIRATIATLCTDVHTLTHYLQAGS
ncbi:hypothetical protein FEF65_02995 [Mariprofundus erugo]|uniref:Uncharacterized protein n=1 Tax=Mariprofundus erugo TaxID=2528639 RepID=A0A5R9GWX0_9PROT|nr:hypothetical protein [Mariprofundus erugo]TLS68683.1 hypothetical protein FEF65_02995 [Mariprofundus erugo]